MRATVAVRILLAADGSVDLTLDLSEDEIVDEDGILDAVPRRGSLSRWRSKRTVHTLVQHVCAP